MITEEIRFGEKWMIIKDEKYVAWGSAHVEAWGSAHVEARDSAHVEARDSAHVVAWGSAHVEAWGSAHVVAWDFSTVVKRNKTVKINKGKKAIVIIPNYPSKITEWANMKNIKIKNGKMSLWKAVQENGTDFHSGKISYLKEAIAPDWDNKYEDACGKGLHLADSPSGARFFVSGKKFRLIQVSANTKDCICFPGNPRYPMKIRARACKFIKEFTPDYIEEF